MKTTLFLLLIIFIKATNTDQDHDQHTESRPFAAVYTWAVWQDGTRNPLFDKPLDNWSIFFIPDSDDSYLERMIDIPINSVFVKPGSRKQIVTLGSVKDGVCTVTYMNGEVVTYAHRFLSRVEYKLKEEHWCNTVHIHRPNDEL